MVPTSRRTPARPWPLAPTAHPTSRRPGDQHPGVGPLDGVGGVRVVDDGDERGELVDGRGPEHGAQAGQNGRWARKSAGITAAASSEVRQATGRCRRRRRAGRRAAAGSDRSGMRPGWTAVTPMASTATAMMTAASGRVTARQPTTTTRSDTSDREPDLRRAGGAGPDAEPPGTGCSRRLRPDGSRVGRRCPSAHGAASRGRTRTGQDQRGRAARRYRADRPRSPRSRTPRTAEPVTCPAAATCQPSAPKCLRR